MVSQRRPSGRGLSAPLRSLYELLSSPTFAIVVVIVLALASILGLVIIDRIPFRGEMARVRYPGREGEPLIWLLIHVVPVSPFRSLVYRVLLASLSLSLFACTIKRWRLHWRQALRLTPPGEGVFASAQAIRWTSAQPDTVSQARDLLRRKLFAVRSDTDRETHYLTAKRFGVSRLGPVFTHLGFLLLFIGALIMASSGSSEMLWMRAGDKADIPGTDAKLTLLDFEIKTTPRGEIADYISTVDLSRAGTVFRQRAIEVNQPLRYRGRNIYQVSYRESPTRVRSIDLVMDLAALHEQADTSQAGMSAGSNPADPATPRAGQGTTQPEQGAMPPAHGMTPGHGRMPGEFAEPVTQRIGWKERVRLDATLYSVEIDTFLADFRIGENGPGLASEEPLNPAVKLHFFRGGSEVGSSWYFTRHPGMAVGSGPDLPLVFASFAPDLMTGLEITVQPGSGWIWVGIAVMTCGTLLTFLFRFERAWLRIRPSNGRGFDITLVHIGAPLQAPEYANAEWEKHVTPFAIELLHQLEPQGGQPVRWPSSGHGGAAADTSVTAGGGADTNDVDAGDATAFSGELADSDDEAARSKTPPQKES